MIIERARRPSHRSRCPRSRTGPRIVADGSIGGYGREHELKHRAVLFAAACQLAIHEAGESSGHCQPKSDRIGVLAARRRVHVWLEYLFALSGRHTGSVVLTWSVAVFPT